MALSKEQLPRYVAAIDFGTSSVSLAYITPLNKDVQILKLNKVYLRVPNAILIHNNEQTGRNFAEAIGYDAQIFYGELEESEIQEYIYFKEIKLLLNGNEVSVFLQ